MARYADVEPDSSCFSSITHGPQTNFASALYRFPPEQPIFEPIQSFGLVVGSSR